jgi:hypothetical protein
MRYQSQIALLRSNNAEKLERIMSVVLWGTTGRESNYRDDMRPLLVIPRSCHSMWDRKSCKVPCFNVVMLFGMAAEKKDAPY